MSFLRVALIKAGVRGAGVIRAILKREYHVFEQFFLSKFGNLVCLQIFGTICKVLSSTVHDGGSDVPALLTRG